MSYKKRIYDFRSFSGPDNSITTSLFEYGIAWKQTKKNTYLFCYGTEYSEHSEDYQRFSLCTMNKGEFSTIVNENWFNKERILLLYGQNEKDFIDSFPHSVYSAISYHNTENIFGISYTEDFMIV